MLPHPRMPMVISAFVALFAATTAPRLAAAFGPAHAVSFIHPTGAGATKSDTRSVTRSSDGTVIVGSNTLAAFDGARWQPIEIPAAYGFRALAPAAPEFPHRVWVGAIGAIGYTEKKASGEWHYTSLLPQLAAAGIRTIRDVWSVRALGSGAVWITDHHAFRWTPPTAGTGGHFDVWHLPANSRLSLFGGGESAWLHQNKVGLLRITPTDPPSVIIPEALLPDRPVTWLVPSPGSPDTLLLGLDDDAFRWTESAGFERLESLSNALHRSLPTDAVRLDEDRIAVSTFNNGVFIATTRGELLSHLAAETGLADNSIYSLFADGDRLWAASPSGLIRIDGAGRSAFFDRHASLDGGRPLDVVEHDQRTYVLTTRNLSRSDDPSFATPLEQSLRANGVFSDLLPSPDGLWIAGFGGIWRSDGDAFRHEYIASADISRLCPTARFPRGLLFLEGYRLKLLVPSTRGGWVDRDLGVELPDSPVSLFEDIHGEVWVSTMTQGIQHFSWNPSAPDHAPTLQLDRSYRFGRGLPQPAGRTVLAPLGGRLFVFADSGILALRPDKLGFEPVAELASFLAIATTRPSSKHPAHWLVQSRLAASSGLYSVLRIETETDELRPTPVEIPGLDLLGPPHAIAFAGNALWIGSHRGWLRTPASSLASPPSVPEPPLRLLSSGQSKPFIFQFAHPAAAGGPPLLYQSRLDPNADWSAPSRTVERSFENLAPQNYRFEVRVLDRFGRASPVAHHEFIVLAPWWKTAPALIAGALLFATIVTATARWQLARLRRHNEHLNRLVAERTRQIELASTAKSEFLDNVSHEIRNPLNGLTGLLAMLNEDRLDARERELTRSLKSVASNLTQVFEEVLQFSKLEYGYGRLDRRPFALRPLLDEVVALFTAQARQAGCALHLVWPHGLVDGFEGDPDKIKTIAVNFVANALKYAPGAPVEIRVEATGENDGLVDLYLDVADHGPGVPFEEQELIFKKFVRGRSARASNIAGTGLGLATCAMLAKMMNGSVGVESAPGRGATFSLKLLLPRASLGALRPSAPLTASHPAVDGPLLIVDDEPYNRTVLEGIARELGRIADTAATVEEAGRHLAQRDYAIVFLDWELPDGNGGELARALRARTTSSHPIILATTAHDSEEMRQRCRDAGMDGFLLKPYHVAAVRQAIAHATQSHDPLASTTPPPAANDHTDAFDFFSRATSTDPEIARHRYLAELDTHTQAIAAALAAENLEVVWREAHRLRALSGLVQATELNRAAARLEQSARNRDLSATTTAWTATSHACETLKHHLSPCRAGAPAPAALEPRHSSPPQASR